MGFQVVKLLDSLSPTIITGGLVPRGAYNAGTDYTVGDSVDYNGSSYVMYVDATAGTLPTDTTKWQVLAEKGDQGDPGDPGEGVATGGTANQALTKVDGTDFNTQWETIDKTFVGLPDVDNTSDLDKPISTDTQTALDAKEPTITAGTSAQYWRGDKSWQALDKAAVGLSNVDNTSDANKPVSTAQQSALDLKADLASPALTGSPTAPTQTAADNSTKLATTAYADAAADAAVTADVIHVLKAGDTMGKLVIQPSVDPVNGALRVIQRIDDLHNGISIVNAAVTSSARLYVTGTTFVLSSNGNVISQDVNGRLGVGTSSPTSGITVNSTQAATGITLYNTADQTTNYERVRQYWNSNVYTILGEAAGTGVSRAIRIATVGNTFALNVNTASTSGIVSVTGSSGLPGGIGFFVTPFFTATSGVQAAIATNPTVNQTSTAGYTAILANVTETSTGSGAKNLLDLQVNSSSLMNVDNTGQVISQARFRTNLGLVNNLTLNNAQFNTATAGPNIVRNVADANPALFVNQQNAGSTGDLLQLKMAGTTLFSVDYTGLATFVNDAVVPDEAYGAGWSGSLEVPTKNALYDKIETMGGGSADYKYYVAMGGYI